jgi:cystine transport system substrate-binding protein
MNKWIKRVVAFSFVVAQFLVIPAVSASSLENIRNEKSTVEEEVTQLQEEVNNGLEEVSEISLALDELNQEIKEHQAIITDTEEDIVAQEILVNERYEYTAEQLKAMQKSEVNQNIVISVLQAESLSDLFNKIYSASVLTGASEARLEEAQIEQEKLDEMKETLLVNQEELDTKQTEIIAQKEALDTKVADLRTTLASNQEQLAQLDSEESAELQRIAEAEERKEAERQRAEERQQATVSVTSSNSSSEDEGSRSSASVETTESNRSNESNNSQNTNQSNQANASNNQSNNASNRSNEAKSSSNKETETKPSSSAGEWMTFQSTGYSTQQPGLSTHTATGIDLRVNPRVIAVDPSVIPLNSLVEVEGMGVYVAGDTGGAINGRIIDIHYPTVSQALSWGRRNVRIRIIN